MTSVTLQDERRDDGNWLHATAHMNGDGALVVRGHDLGPITAMVSDTGEYEWVHTYPSEVIPDVLAALEANADADPITVLKHWAESGRGPAALTAIRPIPRGFWSWP